MRSVTLRPPQLGFIIGTRAALAFGAGLLVARRLSNSRRKRLGRALVAVGALTTLPAAFVVSRNRRAPLGER